MLCLFYIDYLEREDCRNFNSIIQDAKKITISVYNIDKYTMYVFSCANDLYANRLKKFWHMQIWNKNYCNIYIYINILIQFSQIFVEISSTRIHTGLIFLIFPYSSLFFIQKKELNLSRFYGSMIPRTNDPWDVARTKHSRDAFFPDNKLCVSIPGGLSIWGRIALDCQDGGVHILTEKRGYPKW